MVLISLLLLAFVVSSKAIALAPEIGSSEGKSGRLLPMVINTWNFPKANIEAWRVLNLSKGGLGQKRNAVVEGISECERLQCGKAVGYGGSPDERGETSLDAMIMDGRTMEMGAVADLRRINSAIKVARHVLEHTKHSLLVGHAAEDFANEMGFQNVSLVTPESAQEWMQWRAKSCQPNFRRNVHPDPKASCGPYTPVTPWEDDRTRSDFEIGPGNHDTITMIAIDEESNIHVGSSTNGLHYSIPGRVGDAAIPGAGAYADNEVGAAVTTGNGDIMMRFLPSFFAVEAMRTGRTPKEAATLAMSRIKRHYTNFDGAIVAVNRFGEYSVTCHGLDGNFSVIISNPALPELPTRKETIECTKGSDNRDEVPFDYIN